MAGGSGSSFQQVRNQPRGATQRGTDINKRRAAGTVVVSNPWSYLGVMKRLVRLNVLEAPISSQSPDFPASHSFL